MEPLLCGSREPSAVHKEKGDSKKEGALLGGYWPLPFFSLVFFCLTSLFYLEGQTMCPDQSWARARGVNGRAKFSLLFQSLQSNWIDETPSGNHKKASQK